MISTSHRRVIVFFVRVYYNSEVTGKRSPSSWHFQRRSEMAVGSCRHISGQTGPKSRLLDQQTQHRTGSATYWISLKCGEDVVCCIVCFMLLITSAVTIGGQVLYLGAIAAVLSVCLSLGLSAKIARCTSSYRPTSKQIKQVLANEI